MSTRQPGLIGLMGTIGLFAVSCAGNVPVATTVQHTPPPAVVTPVLPPSPALAPTPDPVVELIAVSNGHFETGQRELQLGHLGTAKSEFNQALDVLLESPYGARSEPRIREHFDRLVERISAYEITALAQGDGFTEKAYEPASIDELLTLSTFDGPSPTEQTKEAVAADLESSTYDIDIPLNKKVLSFVELFTGRFKSFLEEGLSRGARFLPMIQDVFRAEGLPLDLAYVPLVESAFKPNALSRAKAKGMWQFMSGTALENGLRNDWYVDERAEPEKATRAAAKYLKTLYGTFGDWHLALASYNAGPGRIQRALRRGSPSDFWKMSATTRYLPRETRDYVPLILAAVIIARNPSQYGMNVQPLDAPAHEKVTLPVAVDLRRVAEWAGTSVEVIQDLNPELRRWTTPMGATDYELKVPEGSGQLVAARLAQAEPEELAPLAWHTVRKGETLTSISRKLKVNRGDLAAANYLSTKAGVKPGQQLVIPRPPTLLLATRADNPPPLTESRTLDTALASNVAPPGAVADRNLASIEVDKTSPREEKLLYQVKRGDTLSSIARLYRTTVASLKTWNRLPTSVLQVGQRLTIFTNRILATD